MTTTTIVLTEQEHRETHDPAGVCWLCGDGPEWWEELRHEHGLSKPPYANGRMWQLFYRALERGI